jgi:hypothetical protein
VLFARLNVKSGMTLNCEQLATAWGEYNSKHEQFENELTQCAKDMEALGTGGSFPDESCPSYFSPVLVDEFYADTAVVKFTSSIFATTGDTYALFDNVGGFSRGTNLIEGVYDTQYEEFVDIQVDKSLLSAMVLASFGGCKF